MTLPVPATPPAPPCQGPDLSLLTAAASALPRQSAEFTPTLAGLAAGQATVKDILIDMSALQDVAVLLEATARIADDLNLSGASGVLRGASSFVQRAASPVADAAGQLDNALSGMLPGLTSLSDPIALAAPAAPLLQQAPRSLCTLLKLSEALQAAPARAAASPVSPAGALDVSGELRRALESWTATSGWNDGLPRLSSGMQALLNALQAVRDSWLGLPRPVVSALHALGAHATQAHTIATVAKAAEELVRAFGGARGSPSPFLTPAGVGPYVGEAADAAKQATDEEIFFGVRTALGEAVSAAKALSPSLVAATRTALSGFSALGKQVAPLLAGTGLRTSAANP